MVGVFSSSTYIDEEVVKNNELMCIITEEFVCPINRIRLNSCFVSHIDLMTGKSKLYDFYDVTLITALEFFAIFIGKYMG